MRGTLMMSELTKTTMRDALITMRDISKLPFVAVLASLWLLTERDSRPFNQARDGIIHSVTLH